MAFPYITAHSGCEGTPQDQLDTVEIVAVCDIIRERAEEVATVLNDPKVVTDWRDLTEKEVKNLLANPIVNGRVI